MTPKVAHVITTFFATNTSAWVSALAEDQQARGWQVEIIVGRNASPDLMDQKRQQGFAVTQVDSLRKYVHPVHDGTALWDLFRLFREKKFHLIHTHLAKAGVVGRLAAKAAGIRSIVHSVYGATFAPTQPLGKYLLYKNLEKLAGRFTDRFVFVGRELHDAYQQAGVCPNGKGAVVYYGKDLTAFLEMAALSDQERLARKQAAGFDPDAIILGNVSRLVPWKGHHYALQVVSALKEEFPQLKLIIVGDAKTPSEHAYKETLLKTVNSLGLEQNVIFTGWQKDPAAYYAIFDIYLLTSMPFEGVPGSVIEAVVAGLPIVAFDCYGLREIPGISARLVPTGDLAKLTAVLKEELTRLSQVRHIHRTSAMQISQLQERFNMSRMVQETFALYQPLLGCNGAASP
jgi:glycosyltransferase involved in cell wall biosynthesis